MSTVKELAERLNVKPRYIRNYLRLKVQRLPNEAYKPWGELPPEVCESIINRFTSGSHIEEEVHMSKEEQIHAELEGRVDIRTGRLLRGGWKVKPKEV